MVGRLTDVGLYVVEVADLVEALARQQRRAPHGISKAALNAVTLSLAQELANDGIRVLGIAPGMVASDAVIDRLEQPIKDMVLGGQMIKRFGAIDDLVGMALLMCSDEASFMTGQTVVVDGGYVRQL